MLLSSTQIISIFMATKNPRVVGYIDPDDHAKLQQFMKEFDCTESKAIALILHSYFSNIPVSTPASRVNEALSSTPSNTLDIRVIERLETLESKLETLGSTPSNTNNSDELLVKIAELEKKLEASSSTPDSTLNNELAERLATLEDRLEALSSTPNDTPQINEVLERVSRVEDELVKFAA
jgi:vacuolar-type H+-ATPase subunit I/STV1